MPKEFRGFPAYLRAAGYYCSNNSKTDYNVARERAMIQDCWDESSGRAHWRQRKPNQPFFSVFNFMETHQSRSSVWSFDQFEEFISERLQPSERHDPSKIKVPPYYPDTPTVRRTLARYHDCVTAMDKEVKKILGQLEEDGLADQTIVFFFGDHGAGLPRAKRVLYDSGLRVPLLIRFPEKYRSLAPAAAGQTCDRLVSFVDFAPTILSLAQVSIPSHMQGHAFLGAGAGEQRRYVHGARDRVDEAFDLSRSVRDERYLYIRNYMPHLSWNQPEGFSDASDMRREITRLAQQGQLNAAQLTYAAPRKAIEELYDTLDDPHQIHNLAGSDQHRELLNRMRAEHKRWSAETRDIGFLPEAELQSRMGDDTPWAMARNEERYAHKKIASAAEMVGQSNAASAQISMLTDKDSAVRYWAAVGLNAAGKQSRSSRKALTKALRDPSAVVRIEAAMALVQSGPSKPALDTLVEALLSNKPDVSLKAARSLQLLGEKARPVLPAMKNVLERAKNPDESRGNLSLRFALEPAVASLDREQ